MENKTKLLDLIKKSKLTGTQKKDWEKVIEQLSEFDSSIIKDLLVEYPEQLDFLTNNIQAKLKAFKTLDKTDLDKILKDEANYLKNIDK